MNYELTPIKPVRVGRVKEMTKSTSTNEAPKASKKYQKSRGEHVKDILIAVLITGVVAFIGGMQFANDQNAEVQSAVSEAKQTMASTADAPASK